MTTRRGVAFAIDCLLIYACISVTYYLDLPGNGLALNAAITYAYFTTWLFLPGMASVGKRLSRLSIRQIRADRSRWRLFLRESPFLCLMLSPYLASSSSSLELKAGSVLVMLLAANILLVLEIVTILSDPNMHRGVRDRIGGTLVKDSSVPGRDYIP